MAALQLKLLGPQATGVCAQKVCVWVCVCVCVCVCARARARTRPCVSRAHALLPTGSPIRAQVSEAEALVAGGIADVLVSNQVGRQSAPLRRTVRTFFERHIL